MTIYYSSKFSKEYKKLPLLIKKQAEKKELWFRVNPFDPRLKTHKLTGSLSSYWAFSISFYYRIIFEFAENNSIVWFHSVGTHEIYDNL